MRKFGYISVLAETSKAIRLKLSNQRTVWAPKSAVRFVDEFNVELADWLVAKERLDVEPKRRRKLAAYCF